METMQYPYSRQMITQQDIDSVVEALHSRLITQGSYVTEFESKLSALLGAQQVVVCNSGTAALHMLYHGIGLSATSGLITSAVTFAATANAARMCGAPVGFADVDPITGLVTLETIKAAVEMASFPVGAIALVHLGGRPCDITRIKAYADSIGAVLVEDACHAPLARYSDDEGVLHAVGKCAHSAAATFSFHAIKHITTGEGGAVVTNDEELAQRLRRFRSHGVTRCAELLVKRDEAKNPWYYEVQELGFNYRLSDLNCALGVSQLDRLEASNRHRQTLAESYHAHLSDCDLITLPKLIPLDEGCHAWHLFAPKFDFVGANLSRAQFADTLAKHGVGTQVHYIPLYMHPYYDGYGSAVDFPGAESFYQSTLSLPIYHGLMEEDIHVISSKVKAVMNRSLV